MINIPEENFVGSEPKKKVKKTELLIIGEPPYFENPKGKEPTGILKELADLKKHEIFIARNSYSFVQWSDVEAIIYKYSNP